MGLAGSLQLQGHPHPLPYLYRIYVQPLPEPRIHSELLEIGGQSIIKWPTGGQKSSSPHVDEVLQRIKSAFSSVLETRSALSILVPLIRLQEVQNNTQQDTDAAVLHVRSELRAPFVFDPQPRLMRAYERIGNRPLARDGANLSAVLHALHTGSEEEQKALARILQRIRQLPEEPFEEFDFVVTPLNDVIFGIRESKEGPMLDARLLSDGTLRCMAVLTALETVEKGSRVIIEEFDNGLHPSRVTLLTEAISEACERRDLKVLVTTHNPATLDGLTPEQLKGVVLCVWDKTRKASRLIPLLELPRADVLLERGRLGDLVTRRVLEQHLMPGFEKEQKAKAQEWCASDWQIFWPLPSEAASTAPLLGSSRPHPRTSSMT